MAKNLGTAAEATRKFFTDLPTSREKADALKLLVINVYSQYEKFCCAPAWNLRHTNLLYKKKLAALIALALEPDLTQITLSDGGLQHRTGNAWRYLKSTRAACRG